MTMTGLPTTLTEADGTTTVVTDMRDLLAAAVVSHNPTTKGRPVLRSVYVTQGCVVATDSYRLVVVGHGDAEALHALGKAGSGQGFTVPADLIVTAGKLCKAGPATVSTDGATVTLTAGGQSFTADRPDFAHGDYPSYDSLLPELDAGVGGQPAWNADYLADMAKIAKHLKASRDSAVTRLLVADELKPSLWHLEGLEHGSALYLLMSIRSR